MSSYLNKSAWIMISFLSFFLANYLTAQENSSFQQGLVGILYDDINLTRPASLWYLEGVDSDSILWQTKKDFSGRWVGYLKAPAKGQIDFYAEVNDEIRLTINGEVVLNTWNGSAKSSGQYTFKEKSYYPVMLQYRQISGRSYMKLFWQKPGAQRQIIPSSALFFTSDQEEDIEDNFESIVHVDLEALDFDIASIIEIHTMNDVREKRTQLIKRLWGEAGYPLHKMPVEIIEAINDSDFVALTHLKRIDKLIIAMDFGLNSIAYHFIPQQSNGELAIYHQGHDGKFSLGIRTIDAFLKNGFSVMALSMPLLGMNNRPVIEIKRFGKMLRDSGFKASRGTNR